MSSKTTKTTRKRKLSPDHPDATIFKNTSSSTVDTVYSVNDKVLCLWRKKFYYEAKIIEVEDDGYTIHYHGWHQRYDEFISKEDVLKRFKPYTEEDAKEAKAAINKARELKKQRKAKVKEAKRKRESTSSVSKKRKRSSMAAENLNSTLQEMYDKIPAFELQGAFDNLLTNDLVRVFLEENDKITNSSTFPKMPVERKKSIQDILKAFLKSKDLNVDTFEASIKDTEDFKSAKFDLQTQMFFFVHLIDKRFTKALIYDEEKPVFKQLKKADKEKELSTQQFTCYSKCLGFTHLLRFIHRLEDILMSTNKITNDQRTSEASNFVGAARDLCDYLEKNMSKFYNEKGYYGS